MLIPTRINSRFLETRHPSISAPTKKKKKKTPAQPSIRIAAKRREYSVQQSAIASVRLVSIGRHQVPVVSTQRGHARRRTIKVYIQDTKRIVRCRYISPNASRISALEAACVSAPKKKKKEWEYELLSRILYFIKFTRIRARTSVYAFYLGSRN